MGRLTNTDDRRCQARWTGAIRFFAVVGVVLAMSAQGRAQPEEGRWRAKPPPETPPPSAAVAEARSRYQKAIKLYRDEGAVEAALAEMQRAYDLAPHFKVLYNVGQAARTLRDYPLALHAFERYLADGGERISSTRRATVAKDIKELRTYVSAVEIRVNVDGAKISVDDVAVGESPLGEPVLVGAGRVSIRAQLGKQRDARTIVVPGGDRLTVELELAGGGAGPGSGHGAAGDGGTATGDPADPDEPSRASPLLWIGVAAAGAFAVGAAITGGVALSNDSDLDTVTYAGTEPPDDVASQQDTVTALAITTDVLIGAAVASLAVTGVLWLVGVGEEPSEPSSSARTEWSLRPWLAIPVATGAATCAEAGAGHPEARAGMALTGRWGW